MRCLVTGATGYIGGRLAPRLLAEGHQVRCLSRTTGRLRDVPWAGDVEIVEGDLAKPDTLPAALDGVEVAYYLVHALGQGEFEAADRLAAENFATAAYAAGVSRIVYLGGPEPPPDDPHASAHLRSRAEVARILLHSEVPTVVLRAPVIIGSGSASFEMLRYLTERLPAMVTPRWVRNRIQPTGFDDAVRKALATIHEGTVETRWANATWPGAPADPLPTDPDWSGGSIYTDTRERAVDASADSLWRVVEGVGGKNGWYSFPLAWSIRGWLDRAVGGVGLRRGRRDPHRLQVGEALDFWRVEEIVPGELLRLRAEMRVPGLAWLEMRVVPAGPGRSRYAQRAVFLPRGLAGHAYWNVVRPFHAVVFGGMARNIGRGAERAVT